MKQGLYLALDDRSEIRHVSDVPRGADCNCRCPVCESPLIARQGTVLGWHFAHQPGQERPDCAVGAANLLRRLSLDFLRNAALVDGSPKLPVLPVCRLKSSPLGPSRTNLGGRTPWLRSDGFVEWTVGAGDSTSLRILQPAVAKWLEPDKAISKGLTLGRTAPVGRLQMPDGMLIHVYLHVLGFVPEPELSNVTRPSMGAVIFSIPPLVAEQWRHRDGIEQHLRATGRFTHWLQQPPAPAWVVDRLEACRVAYEEAERSEKMADERQAALERLAPPHLPGAKARLPSILYILEDEAWYFYETVDGAAIAPALPAPEGWDEALPRSVGTYDEGLGAYRVTDRNTAMAFLSKRSRAIRTVASN